MYRSTGGTPSYKVVVAASRSIVVPTLAYIKNASDLAPQIQRISFMHQQLSPNSCCSIIVFNVFQL